MCGPAETRVMCGFQRHLLVRGIAILPVHTANVSHHIAGWPEHMAYHDFNCVPAIYFSDQQYISCTLLWSMVDMVVVGPMDFMIATLFIRRWSGLHLTSDSRRLNVIILCVLRIVSSVGLWMGKCMRVASSGNWQRRPHTNSTDEHFIMLL